MSVAVVLVAQERRIARQLRAAGATSPESARPLAELGVRDGLALGRLRRRGAVLEGGPGAYYLDESAYAATRSSRRAVILGLAAALVAAGVVYAATR